MSVTELPIGQHVASLAAGQIDAAYTLEPTGTIGRLNGTTRVLEAGVVAHYILGDPLAPWHGGSASLTTEFIKKYPAESKKFIAAYARGIELVRSKPDEARQFMKGYTAIEGALTAEVPLAAYHMDEILDAASLPLRYAGFSPSYRREAGSHGKDTRGIWRVHWFDKVEMFSYCAPDEAAAEHARLLAWEQEFLGKLELPYRVIDVATGDLGSSAVRKFDCEAWIPTYGDYREVTSTSNCAEFQARRLSVRMRDSDGVRPLATLNGTLCAMTRIIVALLENHQQADGSVRVPEALRDHLGRAFLLPVT